jgi:hypothetical protein
MNDREFRALVEKMRAAQRRYFRQRDNLADAKALERDVDDAIEAFVQAEQPRLFDAPEEPDP